MLFPSGDPHSPSPRTCLELDATPGRPAPGHLGRPRRVRHAVRGRRADVPAADPGHAAARRARRAVATRDRTCAVIGCGRAADAGRAWTTSFETQALDVTATALLLRASDKHAELEIVLELESLVGGSLRGRWTLTNTGASSYVVDGLEVVLPVADHLTESLDFTGRHERERTPQRRPVTDGLWLREGRDGRPGLDAATMVVLGTPGFGTTTGEVMGVHVAWSGNSVLRVERDAATGTTVGGGELLLPGEVVLGRDESYATPWVHVATADDGLDGLAAAWHTWQRSLAAHPTVQPVVLNVWEAVYFDHDLQRLLDIADRAARVGVERFVLDDGWFHRRRDDTAGLGDWWIDESVWPDGLMPLIEHVRGLGMEFGLWFEPEMVNPDSELLRTHPDWILAAGAFRVAAGAAAAAGARPDPTRGLRVPVRAGRLDPGHPSDRLREVGPQPRPARGRHRPRATAPRPCTSRPSRSTGCSTQLRTAYPEVAWESCASGGGRIDLGVLERVERVWTSDMTDALARQQIQRWTTQLVAPEYLGAHVSSHTSHTTGRTLDLDFRCATALFGAFGIEWDLTEATDRGPRPGGRVGRPPQGPAPAAARRTRRTTGVVGPGRAAARRRGGRPLGGAAGPRGGGRECPQPRGRGPGARARPRRGVPAHVGGPGVAAPR